MHLVLAAADSRDASKHELAGAFPGAFRETAPGCFAGELDLDARARLPFLAFARQFLPHARAVQAASIRAWASLLVEQLAGILPDHRVWSLHVIPFRPVTQGTRMGARALHSHARAGRVLPGALAGGSPGIGDKRCQLVRDAAVELLGKRRRHLVRYLRAHEGPFAEDESLVQLLLTTPDRGFLSVAHAPLPFRERHVISSFPAGEVPVAVDKQAPSRAFAKLVEAEARLGIRIAARDTCVDLGASPGSWTWVAVRRGARVVAVDRAELRSDLMQHEDVRFQRGDAFRFEPSEPVDWLLCDVIAAAERTAERLHEWLRRKWCRRFVVTLKVDHGGSAPVLAALERDLLPLASELRVLRLSANKNEVCAFGTSAEA